MATLIPNKWQRCALRFLEQQPADARLTVIASPHRRAGLKWLAAFAIHRFLSDSSRTLDTNPPKRGYGRYSSVAFHPLFYRGARSIGSTNASVRDAFQTLCLQPPHTAGQLQWTAERRSDVYLDTGRVKFVECGIRIGEIRGLHADFLVVYVANPEAFLSDDFQTMFFIPFCEIASVRILVLVPQHLDKVYRAAVLQRLRMIGFRRPEPDYTTWRLGRHVWLAEPLEQAEALSLLVISRRALCGDEVCAPFFLPNEVWFIVFELAFSYYRPIRKPLGIVRRVISTSVEGEITELAPDPEWSFELAPDGE